MLIPETTKPGAVGAAPGLANVDLAWRLIDHKDSPSLRQAQRLAARFGLAPERASVVAFHAFGEVRA